MESDFNRFRFRNRQLFRLYSERIIKFVFEQVSFFLEYLGEGDFSSRELIDFVNESAKSCNLMLPGDTALVNTVMDYFCEEQGLCRSFRKNYPLVHEIVSLAVSKHVNEGGKFIDPLARAIIDEFDSSSYETTVEEIASRIKGKPELMFISSGMINEAVNSVYDYFAKLAEDV